jgi:dUTP pyrophosphatase
MLRSNAPIQKISNGFYTIQAALSWQCLIQNFSMTAGSYIPIKIKRLVPHAIAPKYEHPGDSGADLYSTLDQTLAPLERAAIPTGLSVEIPVGYELQVRPKSGLALKQGLTVLNTPGTVDAGYRGEIQVILINLGSEPIEIKQGQKIAQMVLAPVVFGSFEDVEELTTSQRGEGGFGSTGI